MPLPRSRVRYVEPLKTRWYTITDVLRQTPFIDSAVGLAIQDWIHPKHSIGLPG